MTDLLGLLQQALKNPSAKLRKGQEEAIHALLEPPFRVLVVQATGWGKSMVYFLATRVLRDQGKGPTLVISPLLSLMRNQVEAATNLGLRAAHYTSANPNDWPAVEESLFCNEIDLLLISPERLGNEEFQKFIASSSLAKVGLIVIDEAHCISDWGHDFRPDYQRLGELIRRLPATTATANERVVSDIEAQIGANVRTIRGSLARRSLQIQVMPNGNAAERLAWLDCHLNDLAGSGIIYTLTVRDADRVTEWLKSRGHNVEAYHSQLGSEELRNANREVREKALQDNELKALVSTVALGMGFDKPDLGFVVHYQSPGNLVAYYQQIGRAGRAISDAVAILFMGNEDVDIHGFFIDNARPDVEEIEEVLDALDEAETGLRVAELMEKLNRSKSEVERVLKILSLTTPAPVRKSGSTYLRTPNAFAYDAQKESALKLRRYEERTRFEQFVTAKTCYMELVRNELDDPAAHACGRCSNCLGHPIVDPGYRSDSIQAALLFLDRSEFSIEPRKQWQARSMVKYGLVGKIDAKLRCTLGLCLSQYGDPGAAEWVRIDKQGGHFRDELVEASVTALKRQDIRADWACAVPSLRSNQLVPDFAKRLASALGIPYIEAVSKVLETEPQKQQRNSFHQAANLDGAFAVDGVRHGTVLLVDDMVDSGWTFTVIGALLRQAGADAVVPFALTSTKNRADNE